MTNERRRMAGRLRFYQSKSSIFSVLFLLTVLPLSKLQEPVNFEGEIKSSAQERLTQIAQVFDDFVKIRQSPLYATQHFSVRVDYRCKTACIIAIEVISYGHEDAERTEFRYNFAVPLRTAETTSRSVTVKLRDPLVFVDNKALNIATDLHTVRLRLFVSILDINSLSMLEKSGQKVVFASDSREMLLLPPWRRPVKPGYCFPWFASYLQKAEERKIYRCEPVNDVVNFVDFPVALAGKEEGFKKLLHPLDWKDPYLNEIQKTSKPRFTITTWIYVLEACTRNLCGVIQIRNDNFLTPLVALMITGQFHVQVNYENKKAHAFITRGGIRRNAWNQVIMAFNDTVVTFTVRYGDNFENEFQFEHHDFPMGSYHFDDSEGFWILGGTAGFCSFEGFMGPTTLYRRRLLKPSEVLIPSKDHPMFRLGIGSFFSRCANVINGITMKIEEIAIDRKMEESLAQVEDDKCRVKPMRYDILHCYKVGNHDWNHPRCEVTFTGETPEADSVVSDVLKNETINVTTAGERIFDIAAKLMYHSVNNIPLALSLFRVAGCTKHPKSVYIAGVIYTAGLGVPRDLDKAWQVFLMGAVLNHPLSQMSLGYRFLIGGDGVQKRCDISAGYFKMAAVTSDKVLQEHHAVHTHSEAVRLDDYDELAKHKGKDSDVFQWLVHQALKGIGDAQGILGELYFYGKRGIQRDLNESVKYYKMSADMGKPDGLFNLGVSKLRGQGTEKNETEGMELIAKAAQQGFPPALNAMGFFEVNYRANFTGAVIHFKRAAKKGDRDGLYNLGVAYDNGWTGVGVPPDKKKAIDYWHQAAGKGHPGACIAVGEELRTGQHTTKDCAMAVVFLRFIAEQHPEVGWLLRKGLNAYYEGDLYKSLISFVLAGEAGMEVPQYNAALLCEENEDNLAKVTAVDCAARYYNSSAALGWVFSMIKVGDSHWYGKKTPQSITSAARMYAEAAAKNDHPHMRKDGAIDFNTKRTLDQVPKVYIKVQAVYNLAYMVEYNYSLAGIRWNNVDKNAVQKGNLTFAAILYEKCRDSQLNNNESYLPCAFGLVRVTVKDYYRKHPMQVKVGAIFASSLVISFGIWLVKIGDRID